MKNNEMISNMEKNRMNGRRRPHLEVQPSDHCPTTGIVNKASKGPTPNIVAICVSENPDLRSSGGMTEKVTHEAISNPATTALTHIKFFVASDILRKTPRFKLQNITL